MKKPKKKGYAKSIHKLMRALNEIVDAERKWERQITAYNLIRDVFACPKSNGTICIDQKSFNKLKKKWGVE